MWGPLNESFISVPPLWMFLVVEELLGIRHGLNFGDSLEVRFLQ